MSKLFGVPAVRRSLASAALAIFGLCSLAHAQTAIDVNSLDPALKTISASTGPDQTVEAGLGEVTFHGDTNYVSDPPAIFLWVNTTTGVIEETGQDATETAPHADTTYRLVVLDVSTGNWGDASFHVHVVDTTAPQIWLLGTPVMNVDVCTPYFEPGFGVFDAGDGGTVPVTVTGQVDNSKVGVYKLTYTATDSHGNSTSVTRNVDVAWVWSGFQFPINPNGKSVFRVNWIIPVWFAITSPCASGKNIKAKLYIAKVSDGVAGTEMAAQPGFCIADSGNVFRQLFCIYFYNMSTRGMSPGTYQMRIDLGDGADHSVQFSLVK